MRQILAINFLRVLSSDNIASSERDTKITPRPCIRIRKMLQARGEVGSCPALSFFLEVTLLTPYRELLGAS